jgi:serine/threonine protein phosphatase 1
MKRFVLGDIHGNIRALKQVFEKSGFDKDKDLLIQLGDVVDGWPDTKACIEELMTVKNLVLLTGNHDQWALEWYDREDKYHWQTPASYWTKQGGQATLDSYGGIEHYMPPEHVDFLNSARFYYELDGKLFIHAGANPNQKDMSKQPPDILIWDRDLLVWAWKKRTVKPDYKWLDVEEIFIGHTTTQWLTGKTDPIHACNLWAIDTGAGWSGKLTIMDIDTHEYWQSDYAEELYKGVMGRRH